MIDRHAETGTSKSLLPNLGSVAAFCHYSQSVLFTMPATESMQQPLQRVRHRSGIHKRIAYHSSCQGARNQGAWNQGAWNQGAWNQGAWK